jgi:hypothetical protein
MWSIRERVGRKLDRSEGRRGNDGKDIGPTGETDGTDEANVDYIFVAEAGRTEIYLVLRGDGEYFADGRRREKGHLRTREWGKGGERRG